MTHSIRWHVFPSAEQVAEEAARRITEAARQAIARQGTFKLVLAGGSTPAACYRLLVDSDTDWSGWHIYFGDERCLPADDPERNSVMADQAWLQQVTIPTEQVHPIPAEQGAELAATAYNSVIEQARPFDLVLLGIGEDGHTASLFPGHVWPDDQAVIAIHDAPKPPPDRVSLSMSSLTDAANVLVLATGAGKRQAVQDWRSGQALPIARLAQRADTDVLLDQAAVPA